MAPGDCRGGRRAGVGCRPGLRTRLPGRGRGSARALSLCSWTATARIGAICWDLIAGPVLAGTHDFVLASRTRGQRDPGSMLWHQVLAGRVAGWGMGALYGVRYSDMCAFRAIRRDALRRLDMREMTYGWNIEMQMKAARAGLRIQEVPVPYRCRAGGVFEGRRVVGGHAASRRQDRFHLRRIAIQTRG